MTGPDFDDDELETFRPAPHPDDRLWRHPSEIAAAAQASAAHANAETAQVPVVTVGVDERSHRVHRGVLIAAGVFVVGAAALTLGMLSGRDAVNTAQIAGIVPVEANDTSTPSSPAVQPAERVDPSQGTTPVIAAAAPSGSAALYSQVATSLPRIQAAAPGEMREGSGFFVTDDGHIATSAELVASAEYLLAWTEDGQRWKAELVASDPVSDIAVIQIASEDWPAIPLTGGVDLSHGHAAHAIDHDDRQITVGSVVDVGARIQLDQPAALPGSAILDNAGQVIAMATASNLGEANYAVPAWMVEQVAVDLISTGETSHTWLGVVISSSDQPDDMISVSEVVDDSPADAAGIRVGDLIDSLNGVDTPDAATLYRQVQETAAGDDAVLTVTRNGSRRIIIATVEALGDAGQ